MITTDLVRASAKINLYLGIHHDLDTNGYHFADSVMAPLALADEITIHCMPLNHASDSAPLLTTQFAMLSSGDPATLFELPSEHNLVTRALRALAQEFDEVADFLSSHAIMITINKRIPSGAGLGGGSSDAGAVMLWVSERFDLDPCDERFQAIAARLGADVPFFLQQNPAYLDHYGERLQRRLCPIEGELVLIKPQTGVSTVEAYRVFDDLKTPLPTTLLSLLDLLSFDEIESSDGRANSLHVQEPLAALALEPYLANNLTQAARRINPDIDRALDLFTQVGLTGHVTGSGSCTFAILPPEADVINVDALIKMARDMGFFAEKTAFFPQAHNSSA